MILTEKQQSILNFLARPKSRKDVMAEFKLSLVSARDLLHKFVREGLAEQFRGDPKGRGPPYMMYIKKGEKHGEDNAQAQLDTVQDGKA